MAKSKLRVTGFARFFVVMIFVIPLAYLGASWYNGEDGVENIKSWFNKDQTEVVTEERPVNPSPIEDRSTDNNLQSQVDYYQKRVSELESEADKLKQQVWELQKQVNELQQNN